MAALKPLGGLACLPYSVLGLVDLGLGREYELEGSREPHLVSIRVSGDQGSLQSWEYSETGDQKLGKEILSPARYWAKPLAPESLQKGLGGPCPNSAVCPSRHQDLIVPTRGCGLGLQDQKCF